MSRGPGNDSLDFGGDPFIFYLFLKQFKIPGNKACLVGWYIQYET